jgi:TnpA family transposase
LNLDMTSGEARWPVIPGKDMKSRMLAAHLIQNFMVYINTLMIQTVLAQPHWQDRLILRE